jgi:hypothetical protein
MGPNGFGKDWREDRNDANERIAIFSGLKSDWFSLSIG